jgi:hypothetical protein
LNPRQELQPVPYALYAPTANTAATANSVAAANGTGTLGLGQLPGFIITNHAEGVNLTGAFSGNGAGLTNLPSTGFQWRVVSGTNQQAQPNSGYLCINDALTTITLPAMLNLGDTVRVSSSGSGGWAILVNSNQTILPGNTVPTIPMTWTARVSLGEW